MFYIYTKTCWNDQGTRRIILVLCRKNKEKDTRCCWWFWTPHLHSPLFHLQPDTPEYRAACKLWDLYIRTKNEFVQRGDYDDEDEDGGDGHEHPGVSNEEEVRVAVAFMTLKSKSWLNCHKHQWSPCTFIVSAICWPLLKVLLFSFLHHSFEKQ